MLQLPPSLCRWRFCFLCPCSLTSTHVLFSSSSSSTVYKRQITLAAPAHQFLTYPLHRKVNRENLTCCVAVLWWTVWNVSFRTFFLFRYHFSWCDATGVQLDTLGFFFWFCTAKMAEICIKKLFFLQFSPWDLLEEMINWPSHSPGFSVAAVVWHRLQ